MLIDGIEYNMTWDEGTYYRHFLLADIIKANGVVYENVNKGKWQIMLGDRELFSGEVEGISVSDVKDKLEEAVIARIRVIVEKINNEVISPGMIESIQKEMARLEGLITENSNTIAGQGAKMTTMDDDIKQIEVNILDHDLRISTIEENK